MFDVNLVEKLQPLHTPTATSSHHIPDESAISLPAVVGPRPDLVSADRTHEAPADSSHRPEPTPESSLSPPSFTHATAHPTHAVVSPPSDSSARVAAAVAGLPPLQLPTFTPLARPVRFNLPSADELRTPSVSSSSESTPDFPSRVTARDIELIRSASPVTPPPGLSVIPCSVAIEPTALVSHLHEIIASVAQPLSPGDLFIGASLTNEKWAGDSQYTATLTFRASHTVLEYSLETALVLLLTVCREDPASEYEHTPSVSTAHRSVISGAASRISFRSASKRSLVPAPPLPATTFAIQRTSGCFLWQRAAYRLILRELVRKNVSFTRSSAVPVAAAVRDILSPLVSDLLAMAPTEFPDLANLPFAPLAALCTGDNYFASGTFSSVHVIPMCACADPPANCLPITQTTSLHLPHLLANSPACQLPDASPGGTGQGAPDASRISLVVALPEKPEMPVDTVSISYQEDANFVPPGHHPVALKRYRIDSSYALQTLASELLVSRTRSRSLVGALGYSVSQSLGEVAVMTEFFPGGSLFDVIESDAFPPIARVFAARDIAEGLVALLRASPPLVHRDIKPENIFLAVPTTDADVHPHVHPRFSHRQKAAVGDFGLLVEAGRRDDETSGPDDRTGTAGYLPPEAAQSSFRISPASCMPSEWYSLS